MNVSLRAASIFAGVSLALMAVIAPLGVMIALPAGAVGAASLAVLVVSILDVFAAVALYFVLRPGSPLLSGIASALRIAYAAVFAAASGFLLDPADIERFNVVWDAGLFIFGVHLILVGIIAVRATHIPTWIGVLIVVAGLGYVVDTAAVAFWPDTTFSIGQFAFVGEVAMLFWLLGWGGRTSGRSARQEDPAVVG